MQVILISRDNNLYKMCREILTEFHGLDWHLVKVLPENCPPEGNFYIWDNPARIDLPPGIEQADAIGLPWGIRQEGSCLKEG